MAPELTEIEREFLAACEPLARRLEAAYRDGKDSPVLVTKAIVAFAYIDDEGTEAWGYQRVGAAVHDLASVGKMLDAAYMVAWLERDKR